MFGPMKNKTIATLLLALAATSCAQLGDSSQGETNASLAMDLGATPAVGWSLPVERVYHVDSVRSDAQTTVEILEQGDGETVMPGDQIHVHYQGWTMGSTEVFDSSFTRGQPLPFEAGAMQVIEGWDASVVGMQVGTLARLVIPAEMGYGATGAGGVIPPNATLVFEIEIVSTMR